MTDTIKVEVAYARPEKQLLLSLDVPFGTTVAEAIDLSGVRESFPDIEVAKGGVGIFSKKVPLEQVLQDGDRVEIYRPLIADPKESRRRRAAKAAAD